MIIEGWDYGANSQHPISIDSSGNVKLGASSNLLGKVSVDQTTPGTTDSVTVATGQGAGAAIGTVSGAAVTTDINGTIQQYLRGLVKLFTGAIFDSTNSLRVSLFGKGSAAGDTALPSMDTAAHAGFQNLVAGATGGASLFKSRDLGTAVALKASAGTLFAIQVENNQAAAAWIQIFNALTGGVTLGTTNPDKEFLIPANSSFRYVFGAAGVAFPTAITIASTTAEKGITASAAGVQAFADFA